MGNSCQAGVWRRLCASVHRRPCRRHNDWQFHAHRAAVAVVGLSRVPQQYSVCARELPALAVVDDHGTVRPNFAEGSCLSSRQLHGGISWHCRWRSWLLGTPERLSAGPPKCQWRPKLKRQLKITISCVLYLLRWPIVALATVVRLEVKPRLVILYYHD